MKLAAPTGARFQWELLCLAPVRNVSVRVWRAGLSLILSTCIDRGMRPSCGTDFLADDPRSDPYGRSSPACSRRTLDNCTTVNT
jgi:hypothetical protein